jgi:hypothetical protein
MKKIVLILLVLMSLSCSLYDVVADAVYEIRIQKADIYYHEDFESLHTIEDIQDYLYDNLAYKADTTDSWSNAEKTFSEGYGDCDDFAILFMNIYYIVFGDKLDFALIDYFRTVSEGGSTVGHVALITPQGEIISARGEGISQNVFIGYYYSFDLFFY